MNRLWSAGLALGCAALFIGACDDDDPVSPEPVSFSADVQPIFTTRCVACHDATTPPASLDLTAGVAYANTVNVPAVRDTVAPILDRIEPEDPEASFLIHKIQGTQTAVGGEGAGARMPFNCPVVDPPRPCLTPEEIQLIRQWVVEGALNN
jgi:hypothetical protein